MLCARLFGNRQANTWLVDLARRCARWLYEPAAALLDCIGWWLVLSGMSFVFEVLSIGNPAGGKVEAAVLCAAIELMGSRGEAVVADVGREQVLQVRKGQGTG